MADVELRIDYNKKVNYVLEYNRLSVCNSLEIINHSDRAAVEAIRETDRALEEKKF